VKYPLQILLKIRIDREGAAAAKLARAIREEERCLQMVEEKERELSAYRLWCLDESERIMGRLTLSVLPKSEIDRARSQILWNQEAEADYISRLDAAKEALKTATASREMVAEERRLAGVARERISLHREEWLKEERKRAEAQEEAELQEVAELLYSMK